MRELFSDLSNWIWLEGAPGVNCYVQFRQEFHPEGEGSMELHISAEGQYAVYINGEYVPSTQYPDYPFYKSVQVISLEPAAEREEGVLEVQVLYPGKDSAVTRKELPGLRFELWQRGSLLCASGKETKARLMPGYRSGEVPLVTPQLGYGFIYEGLESASPPGTEPGEIHSESREERAFWESAVTVDKDCTFTARPVKELKQGPRKKVRLISQGVFTEHESGLSQYAGFHFRELAGLTAEEPARSGVRTGEYVSGEEKSGEGFALMDIASLPGVWFPSEKGVRFFSQEQDGIYLIFDLGEETVGYLDLDMVCPEPSPVDVSYGEHLEDLRVRTDVGGRHFTFRWEAPGEKDISEHSSHGCLFQDSSVYSQFGEGKREAFVHRFHRLGGRYLQLLIHSHEVIVHYAGLRTVSYPFEGDGAFRCTDHLHNRIYDVAKYTLRCCLHEHYEDCPWREQALYAFDSRNQMLFGYYAFGEFQQPRANLKLLALSQREDGLLELCAPARVNVDIPAFSLMFLVELEEYCRYSGDAAFGAEMLPVAGRILRTVHDHVRDGMVWNFQEPQYWNFYEWRPLLEGTPIERTEMLPPSAEAPLQLFYLLALQRMKLLYAYLDRKPPELEEEIRVITKGLENFWNPREKAYASFIRDGCQVQYAQLVQALALYTEAVPRERREALRERLAGGEFVPVSMSASIFRYEALLQEPEKYGDQVFEEVADRWGAMLYQGASAFWETDLGAEDFERAGSLCHAWSSVPVYLYGAYLLGVRPEKPGKWRVFKGVPCSVSGARGKFICPEGELEVRIP